MLLWLPLFQMNENGTFHLDDVIFGKRFHSWWNRFPPTTNQIAQTLCIKSSFSKTTNLPEEFRYIFFKFPHFAQPVTME